MWQEMTHSRCAPQPYPYSENPMLTGLAWSTLRGGGETNGASWQDSTMLDQILPSGEAEWLYNFFFTGDYPIALQLGVANALCVIAIVLLRASPAYKRDPRLRERIIRLFSWLIISANFFLIFNKDHHIISMLS
jgi:hypothetical protein